MEHRPGSGRGGRGKRASSPRRVRGPSTLMPADLEVDDDLVEERRDPMTEDRQDRDRDDGDQEEQERVLHHRLPLFAIAGRSERQRRPRRKRTKHVHYPSPSSELALTRTLFWQGVFPARLPLPTGHRALACQLLPREVGV